MSPVVLLPGFIKRSALLVRWKNAMPEKETDLCIARMALGKKSIHGRMLDYLCKNYDMRFNE